LVRSDPALLAVLKVLLNPVTQEHRRYQEFRMLPKVQRVLLVQLDHLVLAGQGRRSYLQLLMVLGVPVGPVALLVQDFLLSPVRQLDLPALESLVHLVLQRVHLLRLAPAIPQAH